MALSKPISISTIKTALGVNYNSVGQLCTSTAINKWSKHKPVALAKVTELSDSDFQLVNYGITVPSTGYSSLTAMVNAIAAGSVDWAYQRPTGGISVAPYRMLDFNKYNHSARAPIFSIGNTGSYCDGSSVNLGIGFGRVLPNSETEIALDDLRAGGQSVSNTFGEMYFGICLYDNATHSRCYASTSNVKYKDMVLASISEVGVIVNGVSTPTSGSRRYIAFPFFSTIPFDSWTSSFVGTMYPIPDVSAYHDFTYQSRYTYGGVVGYYLGTNQNTLNYQFSVNSNQYSTVTVTIDVLNSSDQVYTQLYNSQVNLSHNTYRSSVLTRSDGLLWNNAAKIRMTISASGIGTIATTSMTIIRGADPSDPPTP